MFISMKKHKLRRISGRAASRRFTRSKFGNFLNFFIIFCAGLFTMLPLIYAVCTSFKPLDELLIFPPKFFVSRPTLGNYLILPDLMAALRVPLSRYIFNSVAISFVTSSVYVIIAAMAAFVLAKATFYGRNALFWGVQFALMFSTTTLALPQYLIFAKMHIIDTYWAYFLPPMASTLGVFLMKQYIEGYLPEALLEAAKIDGANYYKIFFSIVFPIIKPACFTVFLFTFRDIWAAVPNGTIFTEQLKTLPQIVNQITAGGVARSGSAMAVTVIMMLPPIIVYLISQSNVVEGMSSAVIKE